VRVRDAVRQAGRRVECDAELLPLPAGLAEIFLRPVVVLAYEFDVLVARLRHFFEALLKREFLKHRPEHDG